MGSLKPNLYLSMILKARSALPSVSAGLPRPRKEAGVTKLEKDLIQAQGIIYFEEIPTKPLTLYFI